MLEIGLEKINAFGKMIFSMLRAVILGNTRPREDKRQQGMESCTVAAVN